eukprot:Sspe_Gene.96115::Locus_68507_Transcript_1_1_Confidence_1.000_Length_1577::g.96115::m.96115
MVGRETGSAWTSCIRNTCEDEWGEGRHRNPTSMNLPRTVPSAPGLAEGWSTECWIRYMVPSVSYATILRKTYSRRFSGHGPSLSTFRMTLTASHTHSRVSCFSYSGVMALVTFPHLSNSSIKSRNRSTVPLISASARNAAYGSSGRRSRGTGEGIPVTFTLRVSTKAGELHEAINCSSAFVAVSSCLDGDHPPSRTALSTSSMCHRGAVSRSLRQYRPPYSTSTTPSIEVVPSPIALHCTTRSPTAPRTCPSWSCGASGWETDCCIMISSPSPSVRCRVIFVNSRGAKSFGTFMTEWLTTSSELSSTTVTQRQRGPLKSCCFRASDALAKGICSSVVNLCLGVLFEASVATRTSPPWPWMVVEAGYFPLRAAVARSGRVLLAFSHPTDTIAAGESGGVPAVRVATTSLYLQLYSFTLVHPGLRMRQRGRSVSPVIALPLVPLAPPPP